jgi:hypothetical protein
MCLGGEWLRAGRVLIEFYIYRVLVVGRICESLCYLEFL